MLAVLSQAQAVFEIKSPPSIQGYYTISLGDSTVHYWGNGSIAKKSVEAELMLATGVDSVASAALKGDYTGRIAVIFRGGGVAFATKALRAQAAGAVAVVIVNHGNQSDGSVNGDEVFTMAGGTSYTDGDGAQVTIPVVMISKNSYLKISPVLRSGESVIGYVGGKKVLNYDLKLSPDLLMVPAKSTRMKSITKKGMVSDTLGFSLINNGELDQYNIGVRALIVKGLDTLYNRGVFIDTIIAKDTIGYYFFADQSGVLPFRPSDDLDTGRYDLTFSVVNLNEVTFNDTLIDQYDQDNVVKTSFYVTDSVYAIAKMSSYKGSNGKNFHNVPVWGTATRPGSSYTNYSSCIVYKDANGENLEASSMTFMAYMTSGVLKDNLFKVNVYEWNDPFVDIRDTLFAFNELNPLVDNQEYISKDSLVWDYQKVVFDNPVKLNLGQRYLFCVTTSNPNVMFGFDDDAPSMRGSTVYVNREPLFAIAIDGKYYAAGWSPGYKYIPTISLNINEPACIDASVAVTNESGFNKQDGTAEVKFLSGSADVVWNTFPIKKTPKVSNLKPGTYQVTIGNGQCQIVRNVTIKPYVCNLAYEFSSSDESTYKGNNGSVKLSNLKGKAPFIFNWSGSNSSDSLINNLSPGSYTLLVTDAAGCQSSTNFNIGAFVCNLNATLVAVDETAKAKNDGKIFVNTITGGKSPYTYLWSNDKKDSLIDSLSPGSYFVWISDANNCVVGKNASVKGFECDLVYSASVRNESGFNKNDGSIKLVKVGSSAATSIKWLNSTVTKDSLSKLKPGIYEYTLKDVKGCEFKGVAVVNAYVCNLATSVNVVNESGFSKKDGVAIASIFLPQPNSTYTFKWSHNSKELNDTVKNLSPGRYNVKITDKAGCISVDTFDIAAYKCNLTSSITVFNESGSGKKDGSAYVEVRGGREPYLYIWSTKPVVNSLFVDSLTKGSYTVKITDNAGCILTDKASIGVAFLEENPVNSISIFPNPVSEQVNISFTAKGQVTLLLTGITGNVIESKNVSGVVKTTFNTSNLTNGVYLITIKDNNSNYSYKLIKE